MSDMEREDGRYGRGAFDPVMIGDPDTYDATGEDDDRGPARGWIMLLVVFAVIAGLAAVIYFAYQQGREEGIRTAPPIVRSDSGPEKVAPQDPGGIEIPHQDKRIFERITGGSAANNDDVERLLPPPEEPVTQRVPPDPSGPVVQQRGEASTVRSAGSEAAGQAAPSPARPPQAASPAPTPSPPAPSDARGAWVVQVGAFRDEAQANAQWAALQARHPDIVAAASRDIVQADLGDRGIWYRLRAGGYADQAAAEAACTRLKAAGTDCLVRRR